MNSTVSLKENMELISPEKLDKNIVFSNAYFYKFWMPRTEFNKFKMKYP